MPLIIFSVPPEARLSITPGDVIEAERSDVTLVCDVTAGEPAELLAVRWYRDGELLVAPAPCRRLSIGKRQFCASRKCIRDPTELI